MFALLRNAHTPFPRNFDKFIFIRLRRTKHQRPVTSDQRLNNAKQTQFPKCQTVYNRNYDNELQQKMDNGHLAKTNPIYGERSRTNKPNL